MNAADSDRVVERLREVRARCPELRFGQLVATIGELAHDESGHSLWDVEDVEFAAAVERFSADMARRESNRIEPAAASHGGGMMSSPVPTAAETPHQAK
jgi:hypothetical protein